MSTRYTNLNEAMGRLETLMDEGARIIRDNPELDVERIAIDAFGIHRFFKIPALAPHGHLSELIARYSDAQQAWRANSEADDAGEAYDAAETAVLNFPCRRLDEVRIKASFVLADDSAFETLRSSHTGHGTPSLVPFLRSLLGEAVDNGGN